MKKVLSILIGVTLIITLGLASCAPTPKPAPAPTPTPTPPSTGTVEVRVTDAPPKDEVTSIMVTVAKIEIHKAVAEQEREQQQQGEGEQIQEQEWEQQQTQQGEGEWLSIDIAERANSFDLLKIKGIEEALATREVEAGKYTQVRLTIEKIEVALGNDELKPATVPSGELKFVHPFDVVAGEPTIIILDFDADKSVNITGKDKILVKPVVKLIVRQGSSPSQNGGITAVTQEESQQIAEDFLKNSPTFMFDGIADTLKLVDTWTARCPYCWTFVFEFESRHAGYGDRTGEILAQVITPHRAVIGVEQGKVIQAIMDEVWDMVKQEELSQPQTETGEQIYVDVSYNGQEVEIAVGGLLTVTLESNPTTGFKWELTEITDPTVLELVESKYEPGKEARQTPPVPGAGGEEIWSFKALKKGTTKLSMEYSRPWEGGEKAVETFDLTIVVK